MSNVGGGAATNSGIDFQQRVAAFFVLSMGLNLDCSNLLENEDAKYIKKVSFETKDEIDDIVLTHSTAQTFLQVKRKLSLSDRVNSDFFKTIDQFIRQYNKNQNLKNKFVILTSPDSSRKIINELRKITVSLRLDNNFLELNTLSSSEKNTYKIFLNCINNSIFNNKIDINKDEIVEIIKNIYIINLDIEEGGNYEKAFLVSIANMLSIKPILLWGYIISKTLDWSKNRQSISLGGINDILKNFLLESSPNIPIENDLKDFFKVGFDSENYNIASGREVVIIDSFLEEFDIGLIEFYRFNQDGKKRIKFYENEIEMGNGSRHKLYGRFSTFIGAERFISENEMLMNKRIMIGPINGDYDYDSSPIAVLYSEMVRNKTLENKDSFKCIHCQEIISSNALYIEVDEIGLPFDAGSIHKECVRVSDRVLGIIKFVGLNDSSQFLEFDYRKWFLNIDKSQAVWGGISTINKKIINICWNPNFSLENNGNFCIKLYLENDGYLYALERGKVKKFYEQQANGECLKLNQWIQSSKLKGDPLCTSIDGAVFGTYSNLQSNTLTPLDLLECVKFEVVKYTRGISEVYDNVKNFYAPIFYFIDRESGKPLILNNTIFLLTDPLELEIYKKNWSLIGISLKTCKTEIIDNDENFDKFMNWIFKNQINVLVNPFFDKQNRLMKGVIIKDMDLIVSNNLF